MRLNLMIPYYYTLKTRCKDKISKITYILSNIIPIILYNITILKEEKLIYIFLNSIFVLCSYISIYEIGYIYNDVITIEKEENPTLRLKSKDLNIIKENLENIFLSKVFISIFLMIIIKLIAQKINIFLYFILCISTLLVYYVHNNVRNTKINYLTFFLLSTLRFFTPISLFLFKESIFIYLFDIVVINSLIRNFEIIGYKKYYVKNLNIYLRRHGFRVIYYIFLIIFNLVNNKGIVYYMLFYRTLIYILNFFRNYLKKGKKIKV